MSEKISQMTSGNPAQGSDQIPINRGGANFSVTAQSIANLGGGASSPIGSRICPLPPLYSNFASGSYAGTTLWLYIPASSIQAIGSRFKLTYAATPTSANVKIAQAVVRRQNPVALSNFQQNFSYLDSTPITWGGNPTPTFSAVGLYESDAINVAIDTAHDYWFLIYIDPTTNGNSATTFVDTTGVTNNFLAGYDVSGNVCGNVSPVGLTPQRYLVGMQVVAIA